MEDTLTVAEVAKLLRVQPDTVRLYLERGQLRGYRLGKRSGWRINRTDLEAFIAKRYNVDASQGDASERS